MGREVELWILVRTAEARAWRPGAPSYCRSQDVLVMVPSKEEEASVEDGK